jgi:hypothetical protein
MAVNHKYITDNVGLVTLTLPANAAAGQEIVVQGLGSGGWSIAQNAGQVIHFGSTDTTLGVSGSLAATNRYDSLRILCVVADTEFAVTGGPEGNLTVV